jgi:hypothetical protein
VPQSPVNIFPDTERGKVYVACWESSCLAVFDDVPPGIHGSPKPQAAGLKPGPTIVRGVLKLGVGSRQYSAFRTELLDAAGRRVAELRPGANDVSRLAPGVYFVRQPAALWRVVIAK